MKVVHFNNYTKTLKCNVIYNPNLSKISRWHITDTTFALYAIFKKLYLIFSKVQSNDLNSLGLLFN